MGNKIRGIEHELAMNTQPQLPHGSLIHLVGMAIEELKKARLVTSIKVEEPRLDFLAYNGSRVYNDMSHLEISSPSYTSPLEAVIYDKVTELFAYHAVSGLRAYFKGVNLYKNNISNVKTEDGWRAVSYSTHSSILMDRRICNLEVWGNLEAELAPFMVSRLPLVGGGDYVPCRENGDLPPPGKVISGERLRYVISPRAAFIKRMSSNDTVDARGLFNQRDDPHADPAKYWRLHDINFEALRSPTQIYLRDALEVLIMTAYEQGYYKNPPRLEDPLRAHKEMTIDTENCNWTVVLEGGRRVDAIEEIMNGFYLAGVEEMLSQTSSTREDMMAFNLIEATLKELSERRLEYLIDGLDWITKKALIAEYGAKTDDGQCLCNQYALIDDRVLDYIGERPTGERRETTFDLDRAMDFAQDAIPIVDWDCLGTLIRSGLLNGPESTRDYLRCLVAREFPFLLNNVEWEEINFQNVIIRLPEPFQFNKAHCGDALEHAVGTFTEFRQALDRLNREGGHLVYKPVDDHEKEGAGL